VVQGGVLDLVTDAVCVHITAVPDDTLKVGSPWATPTSIYANSFGMTACFLRMHLQFEANACSFFISLLIE